MMTSEIADLLNKYKRHELTKQEFEDLRLWVFQSDEHKLYVQNFIRFYKAEERWDAYCNADVSKAWTNISERHHRIYRTMLIRRISAVAACLLMLFVSAGLVYQFVFKAPNIAPYSRLNKAVLLTSSNGTQQVLQNGGVLVCSTAQSDTTVVKYNTITTQTGGNFKLVLPDKTTVWINSNSSLRYPTTFVKERHVQLRGEAFFDVTHNGQSFFVEAQGNVVHVLGTQFNVSAYPYRTMTATLVRGRVEVSNRLSRRILHPNEQALIASNGIITTRAVDTTIYTSWITGVFDFNNAPLQNIMEQLAEWYNIDVEYQQGSLRNIQFTGSLFRDRSLDYSLDIIQAVSDVKFKKEDGKLVVYK